MTFETSDQSDEETWDDQQKDNDKDNDKDKDSNNDNDNEWWGDMTWLKLTLTITMPFREHPQTAILETCDLRLDTWDNWEQQY